MNLAIRWRVCFVLETSSSTLSHLKHLVLTTASCSSICSLHNQWIEHINAEVALGTIQSGLCLCVCVCNVCVQCVCMCLHVLVCARVQCVCAMCVLVFACVCVCMCLCVCVRVQCVCMCVCVCKFVACVASCGLYTCICVRWRQLKTPLLGSNRHFSLSAPSRTRHTMV